MAVVGDFPFVRSRKVVLIKVWCLYGFRRVWRFHSVTVVSVSVSALVALSLPKSELSGGPAVAFWRCHSLPEIDELIVGLLPVCLCPGRRCPGYGWESQLWHPPWGYYCSRPAGGPGGCWPPKQPWPTYCCHTPGDTVARAPTWGSDWLRQNDSAWRAAIPQGNYLIVPNLSWWQHLGGPKGNADIGPRPSLLSDLLFPCPSPPAHVR